MGGSRRVDSRNIAASIVPFLRLPHPQDIYNFIVGGSLCWGIVEMSYNNLVVETVKNYDPLNVLQKSRERRGKHSSRNFSSSMNNLIKERQRSASDPTATTIKKRPNNTRPNNTTRNRAASDTNAYKIQTIKNEIKALKAPLLKMKIMSSRNYKGSLINKSLTSSNTYNTVKNIISNQSQNFKRIVEKYDFKFKREYEELLESFDKIDNITTMPELVKQATIILDNLYSFALLIPGTGRGTNAKTRILTRVFVALNGRISDAKMQLKSIFERHDKPLNFNSSKYNEQMLKLEF